jgi:CRP-like cAMP-binding protein
MTHLVALADDLSLKTATGRLAKYLYELAVVEGAERGAKVRVSPDRLRAEELALLLGTVRVQISRSLKSLTDAGAIDLDRRFIRIRDLAILRRFFEGQAVAFHDQRATEEPSALRHRVRRVLLAL